MPPRAILVSVVMTMFNASRSGGWSRSGVHMSPVPEQALDGRRHGELGRRAEPSLRGVVAGLELLSCLGQQTPVVRFRFVLRCLEVGEHIRQPLALLLDLGSLRRIRVADAHQEVGEPGKSIARTARKIGAGEERQKRRRVEKDGQRPAARLCCVSSWWASLVDAVEIRPLLAVDLDVHEVLVHHTPPSPRPRTTRVPSRGTSDKTSSRWTAGWGDAPRGRASIASSHHGYQSTGFSACC